MTSEKYGGLNKTTSMILPADKVTWTGEIPHSRTPKQRAYICNFLKDHEVLGGTLESWADSGKN